MCMDDCLNRNKKKNPEIADYCDNCDKKYSFNNISDFVNWTLIEENENYQFFSHNGKGFDNHFVIAELNKIRTPRDQPPSAIVDGNKILAIYFREIVFKDSLLFIQQPLSKFPAAFGLSELKKGFFPHKFSKPENFNYIGPFPPKSDYGYEYMSASKRSEFESFYNKAKENEANEPFDFSKEVEEYCWSDCQLLAQGLREFSIASRNSSKKSEDDDGLCPLTTSLTLASACSLLLRRNYLKEDKIALLPACGFNPKSNISRSCEEWLKWISHKKKINIRHAKNGGEFKVGDYFVDGICHETKTIYEFQGVN